MTDNQKAVKQVITTLQLSGYNLTNDDIEDLEDVASGCKTADQIIKELDKAFMQQ